MDPLVQAAGGAGRGGGQEGVVNGPVGEHAGEQNAVGALRRPNTNKDGAARWRSPPAAQRSAALGGACRAPSGRRTVRRPLCPAAAAVRPVCALCNRTAQAQGVAVEHRACAIARGPAVRESRAKRRSPLAALLRWHRHPLRRWRVVALGVARGTFARRLSSARKSRKPASLRTHTHTHTHTHTQTHTHTRTHTPH